MAELDDIQAVLENGAIGHLSFPRLCEFMARYSAEDMRELARALIELGVVAARWEKQESTTLETGLWSAYLVLTLAAFDAPQVSSPQGAAPSVVPGSLEQLHMIAVERCECLFYALKGQELWLEYQVASEQAIAEMRAVLDAGRIGEMPFPVWLRYTIASTRPDLIAYRLGICGVTKVRWAVDQYERNHLTQWHAYLAATLPLSSFASPPTLPSERLVARIALYLHNPIARSTRVSGDAIELWLKFRIKLPLDSEGVQLLKVNGIDITEE